MSRVAVITRTKDRPLMLPRARDSITRQSYTDFVWVLVNDAGARNYVEANAETAREAGVNVTVVHRERSMGMEAASNAGVRAVESEYVVIHDDDDSWRPAFLEECVAFIDENPELIGVVSLSHAVYERVEADAIIEIGREPYNRSMMSVQLADMLLQNQFAPISFLFRRSAYDAVGGFDESLPVLGDWDFNLRVLLKGEIGVLPKSLANYHIRETVSEDQVIYGNSITAGVNIHMIQDAKYRNLKLREDLESGVLGLGYLLCQGRQFMRVTDQLDIIGKVRRVPRRALSAVKRAFRIRKK